MALYHQNDYRRTQSADESRSLLGSSTFLHALIGLFLVSKLLGIGTASSVESGTNKEGVVQSNFWPQASTAQASNPANASKGSLFSASNESAAPQRGTLRFIEQANGRCNTPTALLTRPGGGEHISDIALGTPVAVGGTVRVPSGLRILEVYWVRIELASGVLYGFAAADAIQIDRGSPLDLNVRGLDEQAFLQPAPSTEYNGGEGSSSQSGQSENGEARHTDGLSHDGIQVQANGHALQEGEQRMKIQDQVLPNTLPQSGPGTEPGTSERAPLSIAAFDFGLFGRRSMGAPKATAQNTGASVTPATIQWLPPSIVRWLPLVEAASTRHGVDPNLIAIIALVESGGNPNAKSPSGAMGLMQVMPLTGRDIAQRRGMSNFSTPPTARPKPKHRFRHLVYRTTTIHLRDGQRHRLAEFSRACCSGV